MSLRSRIVVPLTSKANSRLDRDQDPAQLVDAVVAQHQELLRAVRHDLIEVATAGEQFAQHARHLDARVTRLDDQARRAVAAGRDDLARSALRRKRAALRERDGLDRRVAAIANEERELARLHERLTEQVEHGRRQRTVEATRGRVGEALVGGTDDRAEMSMALGRAEQYATRRLKGGR